MTEHDYHTIVAEAAAEAYELTLDARFNELRSEADRRLALVMPSKPLVFAESAPGYLAIGPLDNCRIVKRPGDDLGIEVAWRILMAGDTASDTLDAMMLMPNSERQPSNSLRNLLARTADWIEREGRCPDLAGLLRKPAIRVSSNGRIDVRTGGRPPLIFILSRM